MTIPCTAEMSLMSVTTTVEPNIMFIIPFLIYAFFIALVISCLVRVSRYFKTAGNEQKLLRMELGKLAEEVKQIRQELEDGGRE